MLYLIFSELISNFIHDLIGVAVAAAHNCSYYKQAMLEKLNYNLGDWEIAIELSYHIEVNDWIANQPDFQYIINPGFNPNLSDALIAGLRTEICF